MSDSTPRDPAATPPDPSQTPEFRRTKHVVVTGGAGFLGSAIVRKLQDRSVGALTVPRSRDCDLRRDDHLSALFDRVLATALPADVLVIHAAARVGGIGANMRQPAIFFYDNLIMGTKLLHEAWRRGIGKFVAIGTVCAYHQASAPTVARK